MRQAIRIRALAALLTLVMLVSLFPVAIHAAERENLALSATPTANSAHSVAPVKNLNDNNTTNSSRWSAARTFAEDLPIWCQLSWDEAVTFDNVVIYEWTASLRSGDYNLSVSDDGVTFTTIYSGSQIGAEKSILLATPVTAKHLRLTVTSIRAGQNETCSINEIKVYNDGLINEPNLARRAEITANNFHSSYPPARLNDGVTTGDNRWSSTGYMNDTGVWVQLNWNEAVTFDQVKVYEWETSIRAKDFTLLTSDDGETFTPIYTGQELGRGRSIFLDEAVTTKHLRLHMTSTLTGSNDAPTLSEVEVYLSGLSSEPNLARRSTATTNSPRGGYGPELVLDGIKSGSSSRWVAQDSTPMPIWVQLNWDRAVTFDTVKVYEWPGNQGYRTDEYKLEISDDGESWTSVDSGNGLGEEKVIVLDQAVSARHLRLTLLSIQADMLQNEKPCINEIEVYDNSHDASLYGVRMLNTDAEIDQEAGTVTFRVDPGTNVSSLTPVFTTAGATVSPEGPQDFNEPVTYTVTAKDGVTTRDYVVRVLPIAYLTDADLTDTGAADVAVFGPAPSVYQYEYHRQELAAFLHFNMNTFTGSEWGNGKEKPAQFTLTEKVDADAYVQTLKKAGFGKLIVTAKHHDGFCIWDSAWTEHDTMSTNYPGGDVLADLSVACSKYDLDMGLYLSPWDENSVYYGYYDENGNPTSEANDALDYNDYYAGQLAEILGNPKYGNKGRFVEVWMDGAKGSGADAQNYDFDRYIETIQTLQGKASGAEDDVLLFGAGKYTTVRWIGNESGVANEETWAKAMASYNADGQLTGLSSGPSVRYKDNNTSVGVKNGNKWSVPEVDARITSGWFWGESKKTPKTLEALREMYCHSVGHNAPLLLNVPLNNQGKLDEAIRIRVEEWGENIRKSFFENNLAAAEGVTISASGVQAQDIRFKPSNVADGDDLTYWTAEQGTKTASLVIDFGKEVTFDALTMEEEILHGQRVEAFSVFYKSAEGEWIEYFNGTTIGGKRVVMGKPVRATQVKLTFQGMTDGGVNATPVISHVGVYKATDAFQIGSAAPEGVTEIDASATNFDTTGWDTVKDLNATGTTYHVGEAGDVMTATFSGTKAWLVGRQSDAVLSVTVDDGEARTVKAAEDILFETGDLSVGSHTIRVEVLSGTAVIDSIYVLDNGGKGLLDFEYDTYTVDEDLWFDVKVVRKGGSSGAISAIVQDNPGSAVQSSYMPTEGIVVEFADGETEKTVSIRTKRYTETTGTLSFSLDLVAGDGETGLVKGMNTPAIVNIIDAESYPNGYLQGITVTKAPDKTEYKVGETLDPTGLVVEGTYSSLTQWETVAEGSGLGRGKTIQLDQPITASNLRLTMTSVLAGVTDVPGISEIEIYGANGENLARSATPSAISEHPHPNGYKANRLNDGITTGDNRWSASNAVVAEGGLPAWVQLTWNEPVTFDTIVIYEWEAQTRADSWILEASREAVAVRPLEASQYTVTPTGELTGLGEQVCTVTAVEDASVTADFTVQVTGMADVTVSITGETDTTVDTESLTYTLSLSDAYDLATATVTLALDETYLTDPVAEPINGWWILAQSYENGKLTMILCNNDALTGDGDICRITAKTTGKVGAATVSIAKARLSAYIGEGETYVTAIAGEDAVTNIDYCLYDVNRDGVVNQLDLTRAQRWFGTTDPICDVDASGEVDIADLILIANHYRS